MSSIESRLKSVYVEFARADSSKVEVVQRPKAEENVSVAAASIIARDLREDYLDHLSNKLQTDLRSKTIHDARSDERRRLC